MLAVIGKFEAITNRKIPGWVYNFFPYRSSGRLDDEGNRGRLASSTEIFLVSTASIPFLECIQPPIPWVPRDFYPGGGGGCKVDEAWISHLPPCSPPSVFVAWCLIKLRGSFKSFLCSLPLIAQRRNICQRRERIPTVQKMCAEYLEKI